MIIPKTRKWGRGRIGRGAAKRVGAGCGTAEAARELRTLLWEAKSAQYICVKWMNEHACMLYRQVRVNRENLPVTSMANWLLAYRQKAPSLARISKVPRQAKVVPSLVPAAPARELLEGRDYLSNIGWVPSSAPGMWPVLNQCFFECANASRC